MKRILGMAALALCLAWGNWQSAAAQQIPDRLFGCAVGRTTLPEARKMLAGCGIEVRQVDTVSYGEPLVACRAGSTAFGGYHWDTLTLWFRGGVLERVEFKTPGDMKAFALVRDNLERLYEGKMSAQAGRPSVLAMADDDMRLTLGAAQDGGTSFVYLSFGTSRENSPAVASVAATYGKAGSGGGEAASAGAETVFKNNEVETQTAYPGGEAALLDFVAKNLVYPAIAMENGVQGTVIVRFKVGADGCVSDVSVAKSLSLECDKAACAVVRKLKRFVPAKQGGKAVAVWYMLPVRFRLQ